MVRKQTKTVANAERTPDLTSPARYRARVYHEIEVEDGVKRVEPGFIVTAEDGAINVYPPEVFAAEFSDVTDIPDQPED
jgi:hypothetical protein